jgi:hypothetical protein
MFVKLHDSLLSSSALHELKPDERAVFLELLLVAARSPTPGTLEIAPGIPWSNAQLAKVLVVSSALLHRAFDRMISADILTTDDKGRLHFKNWRRYQSDSLRVMQWRSQKGLNGDAVTPPVTANVTRPVTRKVTQQKEKEKKNLLPPVTPPRRARSGAAQPKPGLGFAAQSKHGVKA